MDTSDIDMRPTYSARSYQAQARGPRGLCRLAALLLGTVVPVTLDYTPAVAESQDQQIERPAAGQQYEPGYSGGDFTRPENKLDIRTEIRSSGTTSKSTQPSVRARWNGRLDLDDGWKASWYVQLPFAAKATKDADTNRLATDVGAGDLAVQGAIIREITNRLAIGFGAEFSAPTGSPNDLGSGNWQVTPGGGFRYSFLEAGADTYFVPKLRYVIGITADPSHRKLSEAQFAPTLNIGLPDRWFLTLYPSYDIRWNYGEAASNQTGRLFLPLDVAVGRKITKYITTSVEVSAPIVYDYPVYKLRVAVKLSLNF